MRIGAYLKPKRVTGSAREVGADSASIFLGNPRSFHGPLAKLDPEVHTMPIWVHAPYAVSIPHHDEWVWQKSAELLTLHCQMAADIGALGVVVHAGSWKKTNRQDAVDKWRRWADSYDIPVKVLIENQAGGKTSMAATIEDLEFLRPVFEQPMVGVCLDTAHVWGRHGVDYTEFIESFRSLTGRVDLVHANGSKADGGSGRDQHSPFADSTMSFDLVTQMVDLTGCQDLIAETADPLADIKALKEVFT